MPRALTPLVKEKSINPKPLSTISINKIKGSKPSPF